MRQRFHATLQGNAKGGATCELEFDVKKVFGKARAPVRVTIHGYSFRTTTIAMGGRYYLGINKANQAGAGIRIDDSFEVLMELDEAPRVVAPPPDLARALRDSASARAAWNALSYTAQREAAETIDGAKKPETKDRRLVQILDRLKATRKK